MRKLRVENFELGAIVVSMVILNMWKNYASSFLFLLLWWKVLRSVNVLHEVGVIEHRHVTTVLVTRKLPKLLTKCFFVVVVHVPKMFSTIVEFL
jgi:hypothetical protein